MVMSRRKGHDFERWLARYFRERLSGCEAHRGGSAEQGQNAAVKPPDVVIPGIPLWTEAKRRRRANVRKALAEAIERSAASLKRWRWRCAVIRDDGAQPFVALPLDDFTDLLIAATGEQPLSEPASAGGSNTPTTNETP